MLSHSRSAPRTFTFILRLALIAVVSSSFVLPATAEDFSAMVEGAHGGASWDARRAVAADIRVEFGGNLMIDGHMISDTPVGQTRFELADGTVLVFNGQDAFTAPADSKFQGTRFHVLTWPYFLAAPMKLDDPGAHLEHLGKRPFRDGKSLDAARLTFGSGVGDSPEDWYVVYRDDKGRLAGMAYIVTFGKSAEEAEKEPHAITYHDYQDVNGVQLATRWTFWNWNEKDGVVGEPIGGVVLKNLEFVEPASDAFQAPKNARKEARPAD